MRGYFYSCKLSENRKYLHNNKRKIKTKKIDNMIDIDGKSFNAKSTTDAELGIIARMANRHGLITGATGTGKTCTLQNLAETFSAIDRKSTRLNSSH